MNCKRSLRKPDSQRPAAARVTRGGEIVAASIPRVLSASLIAAALYGTVLPAVAQTAPPKMQATRRPRPLPANHNPRTFLNQNDSVMLRNAATGADVAATRNRLQVAPFARLDPKSYLQAIQQRQRMPSMGGVGSTGGTAMVPLNANLPAGVSIAGITVPRVNIGTSTGQWFPLGPYRRFPGAAADQGQLPVAGRVNAVDYAKDKSGIFYLATASGGVWKYDPFNTDHLNSANPTVDDKWTHFSDGFFPVLETSSIAVDPLDHRIAYVGSGDYNERDGFGFGVGIMKTVNGGATWYNIGNGNPAGSPAAAPIMEGTAVSAIVINPTNTSNILATSGRGVNPGKIWYSTDKGNTWTVGKLPAGDPVPSGDWSSLSVSNLDNTAAHVYFYATLENRGVYRSTDGITWSKLAVPLVYNGTGNGGAFGLKVVASKIQKAVNIKTGVPLRIVYVVDASGNNSDGRIFKTVDGGTTWVDITGDYPTNPGPGNAWGVANFSLSADTSLVPVQGNGTAQNPQKNLSPELLTVGTRKVANSLGGIQPYGPTGPTYNAAPGGGPISEVTDPGAGPDWLTPPGYLDSQGNRVPNANTHGFAQDPSSYLLGNTFITGLLLTDGGIYQTETDQGYYQIDPVLGLTYYQAPDTLLPTSNTVAGTPNDQLVIAQLINGDYFQVGDYIRIRGSAVNTTAPESDDALSSSTSAFPGLYSNTYLPSWTSFDNLPGDGSPQPSWALVSWDISYYDPANSSQIDGAGGNHNPNGVPGSSQPGIGITPTMDTFIFDPNDSTGDTQYTATSGSTAGWPYGKHLYYTTANWQLFPPTPGTGSMDITPDNSYNANNRTYYWYNTTDPGTAIPGQWQGEYRPDLGLPMTTGYANAITQNLPYWRTPDPTKPLVKVEAWDNNFEPGGKASLASLYTGGSFLWRFDPPGSLAYPPQRGPIPPQPVPAPANTIYYPFSTAPNQDHGIWRRVGGTQLAAGNANDYISAIAVAPQNRNVIYVGTSGGNVWVTSRNLGPSGTSENIGGANLPNLDTPWKQLAGPGLAGNTLPTRPVTAISVNSDPSAQSYGDIMVTLAGAVGAGGTTPGGAPIPGRVYRCTNTFGTGGTPVFTNASGTVSSTSFAYLPDSPVNAITRDPLDPTNTIFVATDVGVFSSIDAGSTWTNATTPLGLPNVACTSLKVTTNTDASTVPGAETLVVGTFGRGVWGFDITNVKATILKPNLVITSTLNRTATEIIVNLKISNQAPSVGIPFGTAYNVLINTATLQSMTGAPISAYLSSSNPAGSVVSPANPIKIGTVGQNQSTFVTLRYPASAFRPGTLASLRTTGGYTLPPIPPGTPATFSSTGTFTRLP
jgi:hypothetical protein